MIGIIGRLWEIVELLGQPGYWFVVVVLASFSHSGVASPDSLFCSLSAVYLSRKQKSLSLRVWYSSELMDFEGLIE